MKIREISSTLHDGIVGYSFWCVACNRRHAFYTHDGYTNNRSWTLVSKEPVTVQPSIKLTGHYGDIENFCCHLFIQNGRLIYLSDCTHHLAGKEVDMIDFPISTYEENNEDEN